MRAKDFIKLYESPGFNASGPSGIQLPRGYNSNAMTGGMYQTGRRFGGKTIHDFNRDPLTATDKSIHADRINQRIDGGMSEQEAIIAYAKEIAVSVDELMKLYNRYKSKFHIT